MKRLSFLLISCLFITLLFIPSYVVAGSAGSYITAEKIAEFYWHIKNLGYVGNQSFRVEITFTPEQANTIALPGSNMIVKKEASFTKKGTRVTSRMNEYFAQRFRALALEAKHTLGSRVGIIGAPPVETYRYRLKYPISDIGLYERELLPYFKVENNLPNYKEVYQDFLGRIAAIFGPPPPSPIYDEEAVYTPPPSPIPPGDWVNFIPEAPSPDPGTPNPGSEYEYDTNDPGEGPSSGAGCH